MGILVFTIALIPAIAPAVPDIQSQSGPLSDRIVPRSKDTARILYITYFTITVMEIILLVMGGMSLYEASLHTFGTVGTGGFSTRNASIGAVDSTYIHMVIAIFMSLSGINFSLYFDLFKRRLRTFLTNEELRLYLSIICMATLLIGINLYFTVYDGAAGLSFRDAFSRLVL